MGQKEQSGNQEFPPWGNKYTQIIEYYMGTWVAQSVTSRTLAQVMILQFMSSSSVSGSVLMPQSLEPASDSVAPSLSAPHPLMLCCSVSLSVKNK